MQVLDWWVEGHSLEVFIATIIVAIVIVEVIRRFFPNIK